MTPVLAATPTAARLFLEVARAIDGGHLVGEALAAGSPLATLAVPERLHVLALGKVAVAMMNGLLGALGSRPLAGGLVIAPEPALSTTPPPPPEIATWASDHPAPTARSLEAAARARAFVNGLGPDDRLLVLLSGGASALMAAPAGLLTLDEKRAAVTAVARSGATIHQLNAVRKHLSAVKGGRLGLATAAPTTVLALSDVVGNDPGTIGSGPFSADASSFREALALLDARAPGAPARVRAHLARGAAGALPETPKPGDPRLAHVSYQILAGPERVIAEARRVALATGLSAETLVRDTEASVDDLARLYGERARQEVGRGGGGRVFLGNGEPTVVVRGTGVGGRSTHLALLVARAITGLAGVSFLAAGTDDRDGNTDASGAIVDGGSWSRAEAAGLDPAGALASCDSARPLAALGCLVRGPGTSNLLDLHLLVIEPPARP